MLSSVSLAAQDQARPEVEMANVLHQNGKIYLVVLVLLTIFAGVLFMLNRIERKLIRLEKEQKN
jgi:nitrate reductase gamma subunit